MSPARRSLHRGFNRGPGLNHMNEDHYSITAVSLGKRFGAFRVFNSVSFSVESGSSLAVTGPNGAGKSTLLEIAAGLQVPSSGEISFTRSGIPCPRPGFDRIGFASPRLGLYGELSPDETMDFICAGRSSRCRERARELLAVFGLDRPRHRPVSRFSSGMVQRLRLACALFHEPPLLFLDEPGSNLDADGRRALFSELERAGKRSLIIIATNDAEEAAFCAGSIRLD